jgi:hypothetical protein
MRFRSHIANLGVFFFLAALAVSAQLGALSVPLGASCE